MRKRGETFNTCKNVNMRELLKKTEGRSKKKNVPYFIFQPVLSTYLINAWHSVTFLSVATHFILDVCRFSYACMHACMFVNNDMQCLLEEYNFTFFLSSSASQLTLYPVQRISESPKAWEVIKTTSAEVELSEWTRNSCKSVVLESQRYCC